MKVAIHLYHEQTDFGTWVWWATSPDLPGFSATDESLGALKDRIDQAVTEIAHPSTADVSYHLPPQHHTGKP